MNSKCKFILILCLSWNISTQPGSSHVALLYPKARSYDLDFLDTFRTPAPCGMPKDGKRTFFKSGSEIKVQWHLGYPHQGGFKLELLDSDENYIKHLTPSSEFISNDTTAQSYTVKLPEDMECQDCTIRLTRQALEWGKSYKFLSCADVDILKTAPKQLAEGDTDERNRKCSGHGDSIVGRCRCHRLHYGNVCQFSNECENDSDCGGSFNRGKCHIVSTTSGTNQKQCFCSSGWIGKKCDQESSFKLKSVQEGLYTKREIDPNYTLMWRILEESHEIEVVMVANTTGYVGLGWRPSRIDKSCKQFPQLQDLYPPKSQSIKSGRALNIKSQNSDVNKVDHVAEKATNVDKVLPEHSHSDGEQLSTKAHVQHAFAEVEDETSPENDSYPESEIDSASIEPEAEHHDHQSNAKVEQEHDDPNAEQNTEMKHENDDITSSSSEPEAYPEKPISADDIISHDVVQLSDVVGEEEPSSEPETHQHGSSGKRVEKSIGVSIGYVKSSVRMANTARFRRSADPVAEAEDAIAEHQNVESESKSEAGSESNAEPEAETSDDVSTKTSRRVDAGINKEKYVPKRDFHAMDCMDMVIGMARGNTAKVQDYYTRDRSTPREDSFWGGDSSLSGATGWEVDGQTTIVFRKSLSSSHFSDHSIVDDDEMLVIWALGQEHDDYNHNPSSGLEKGEASVPDFYKPDELKYHGKRDRGQFKINFFDEIKQAIGEKSEQDLGFCGGEWRYPKQCESFHQNSDNDKTTNSLICEYSAKWSYESSSDAINFEIKTAHSEKWTGIGFSDNQRMLQSDVILGIVDSNGRVVIKDMWASNYLKLLQDSNQDISNREGSIDDGVMTLKFTRPRQTTDSKNDVNFEKATNGLYFLFPVEGGGVQADGVNNYRFEKHDRLPSVSAQRITVKPCVNEDGTPTFTTPIPPQQLVYDVTLKFINLGQYFQLPVKGSTEYEALEKRLANAFKQSDLKDLDGLDEVSVSRIRSTEKIFGELEADFKVILNKEKYNEKHMKEMSSNQTESGRDIVQDMLKDIVTEGAVGNLRVDPLSLKIVAPVELSSTEEEKGKLKASTKVAILSEDILKSPKFLIILASIASLIFVIVVQIFCTLFRRKSNSISSSVISQQYPHKQHHNPQSTASGVVSYYDHQQSRYSPPPLVAPHHTMSGYVAGHDPSKYSQQHHVAAPHRRGGRRSGGGGGDFLPNTSTFGGGEFSLSRGGGGKPPPSNRLAVNGGEYDGYNNDDSYHHHAHHHPHQRHGGHDSYFTPEEAESVQDNSNRRYAGHNLRVYVDPRKRHSYAMDDEDQYHQYHH